MILVPVKGQGLVRGRRLGTELSGAPDGTFRKLGTMFPCVLKGNYSAAQLGSQLARSQQHLKTSRSNQESKV